MASLMIRKKCLKTINYSDYIYRWEDGYQFSVDIMLVSEFVNYAKKKFMH